MNKEEEYGKWCDEKHEASRGERSTVNFYDKDFWDAWEWRFDTRNSLEDKAVVREYMKKINFLKKYKLSNVSTALDVGCGFGFFVHAMSKALGIQASGCDISKHAIDKAPDVIKNYLIHSSIQDLDFPNNAFDLVTAHDVLEHLYYEEFMKAIEVINRLAKKFIIIHSPVIGYDAEPWLTDYSVAGDAKEHVSIYPWDFWVRRFLELDKFEIKVIELWDPKKIGREVEAIILLRRRSKK